MKIVNQSFTDDTIELDSHSFEGCTFLRCHMIYRGKGSVGLENCTFTDVRWEFKEGAGNALAFIRMFTDSLGDTGRYMLINTFPAIQAWIKPEHLPKDVSHGEAPTNA